MKKVMIILVFVLAAIGSAIFIPKVTVNYDLKQYLPSSSNSAVAIERYEDLYGASSQAEAMVEIGARSLEEWISIKDQIQAVEGVLSVTFIDAILNQNAYLSVRAQADAMTGAYLDMLEAQMIQNGGSYATLLITLYETDPATLSFVGDALETYWHPETGYAWMQIAFDGTSSSEAVQGALSNVKVLLGQEGVSYWLSGDAVATGYTRSTIENEVAKITWVVVPLILLVLLWMTPSFFDLVLFLLTAGIAIVINLGTNAFLPSISFITQSMAIVLQLAISLDYMIFVVHRYHRERDKGLSMMDAIKQTKHRIAAPVLASALTTGVSFLALAFMRFSIGLDIGIVFFKAVMISLLCSIFLMPALISIFGNAIEATKHKTFSLRFAKIAKTIQKGRVVFLVLLLVLIAPVAWMQSHNDFIYGDSAITASEGGSYHADELAIEAEFGRNNTIVLLTNASDASEAAFLSALTESDLPLTNFSAGILIKQTVTDPILLQGLLPQFYQNGYSRIIMTLDLPAESEETAAAITQIQAMVSDSGFETSYLLGSSVVAYDIKDVITADYTLVTILALVGIMVIIFFTFKNLLMPVVLPLLIETSVFLTMSIPYLTNQTLVFLAYLIVSAILLGATIDYAILLSKTYLELRKDYAKEEAITKAIESSAPSIFTSATIFMIAGLAVALISTILAISQIGLVIAIGALVSMLFVLVMLPQLLHLLDHFIIKANFKENKQ
ncbi:MAG: MMPL family transporter [Candidatus Izemoplasmatales bacterium]|nr:MMPL family transporter [Candidatus Izemoplasmatales bacterium]